jgi:hypothetical protein
MRKLLVILLSTVITVLNINSYGDLNDADLQDAKLMAQTEKGIDFVNSTN